MRSIRNVLAALMLSAGLIGGVTLATDAASTPTDTVAFAQTSMQATPGATPSESDTQCQDDNGTGKEDNDNNQDDHAAEDTTENDASEGDADEASEQENNQEDSDNIQDENSDDDKSEGDTEDNGSENESANAQPGELTEGKDLLPQTTLTVDEAINAAQGAQSGDLGSVELEERDGTLVFEVTVGNQEVFVDAANGTVVSVDPVQSLGNDCEDESGGTATPGD